jgi:cytochrome P450
MVQSRSQEAQFVNWTDLVSLDSIQDPYPGYRWLRENAPVWQLPGTSAYFVSSWELVSDAVGREADFSSHLHGLLYTGPDGQPTVYDMRSLGQNTQTLGTADPPEHARHRKAVFPHMVERKMVSGMEPVAQAETDRLLTRCLTGSPISWVDEFANLLPMTVLVELIGLHKRDIRSLVEQSYEGTELLAGTCTAEKMNRLMESAAATSAYLADELAGAPPDPRAGILGALAKAVADGVLTEAEAISTLVILFGAGGESTASLIGNAVRMLAEQPDIQDRLRAEPDLIAAFVEETVRLESPFKGHYRQTTRDTTLGGVDIPGESMVFLMWASANRDPEHFAHPDTISLHDVNPRGHLGFGRGRHYCIGAPLARTESRVAIKSLLERTRSITLAPESFPEYTPSLFVRRHSRLDVVLEPC